MKRAAIWGPWVGVAFMVWRQVALEAQVAKFIAAAQRVLDVASADLAAKATELHERAVEHGARSN